MANQSTEITNKSRAIETAESILLFWFSNSADDAEIIREKWNFWWKKNSQVDDEIQSRFETTLEAEIRGELESWGKSPRSQLARTILLDQLSRNMYRDTWRAFAHDKRTRDLVREALEQGMDKRLRPVERVFMYMPFEHSEDSGDQMTSEQLFAALVVEVPDDQKPLFRDFLDYAVKHKAVIDRFGRFPHRNTILGRESTLEEKEFLKRPGSSF